MYTTIFLESDILTRHILVKFQKHNLDQVCNTRHISFDHFNGATRYAGPDTNNVYRILRRWFYETIITDYAIITTTNTVATNLVFS